MAAAVAWVGFVTVFPNRGSVGAVFSLISWQAGYFGFLLLIGDCIWSFRPWFELGLQLEPLLLSRGHGFFMPIPSVGLLLEGILECCCFRNGSCLKFNSFGSFVLL